MITIAIINYHNEDLTINYVNNELSKIVVPYNLVIINNDSTSSTNDKLAKSIGAQVVEKDVFVKSNNNRYIISSLENLGFARGNNLAARFNNQYLKSDYILFSNNDIRLLDVNVVERLIQKLQTEKKAGIIGPKIVGLKGEKQSPEPFLSFWDRHVWMYLSTPFYSNEKKKERFCLNYSETAQEGFHYKLMGSFFMVRSADFERCGMMDENTFLYAEEPILTERMKRIGLQPYYYPDVAVLHDHGATTKKHLNGKIKNIQFESECYYYRTYIHTPIWQIWAGKIVHFLLKMIK